MMRHSTLSLILAIVAVLVLALPAWAGGWAVVTVDSLPTDVQAGETLHLGFMVRQHGVTPIDTNPLERGGKPLMPYVTMTNRGAGATVRFDARKEGPLGHFVVDVTVPSAGTWDWKITPPPFAGTDLEPLTVAPAAVQPGQPTAGAPVSSATTARRTLGALGALMLLAAAVLALTRRPATATF